MNKADLIGLVAQAQKPEVMKFLISLKDEIDRDIKRTNKTTKKGLEPKP